MPQCPMLVDHFPLYGLRLRTPRLELRLAELEELATLADVALAGVHDPDVMPFAVPWTETPEAERARGVAQNYWRMLGGITAEAWGLPLVVFRAGTPLGMQAIQANDFGILRAIDSGSWLGQPYQGQGLGTEMRAAALHLAFAGLDARYALSQAFDDNAASERVSVKLGYQPDGLEQHVVQGKARMARRYRISREGWQHHHDVPVEMTGIERCRPLLDATVGQ